MLKRSVSINHDDILLFTYRKLRRSLTGISSLFPLKKSAFWFCLSHDISMSHIALKERIGGFRVLAVQSLVSKSGKHGLHSDLTSCFEWQTHKKCSFVAFLSCVEEQPVLVHKCWHKGDTVTFGRECGTWNFCHEKNFLPKMHTKGKKGTHLGWQMDLQISSLQDKRRKCIMQSEEKKFLCITRIKTASCL